jgi:hypothetical protein
MDFGGPKIWETVLLPPEPRLGTAEWPSLNNSTCNATGVAFPEFRAFPGLLRSPSFHDSNKIIEMNVKICEIS